MTLFRAVVTLTFAGIALFTLGCATGTVTSPGNPILGIETFRVSETDSTVVIVGLDSEGSEVAHASVVAGRFTMSPAFAEGRIGAAAVVEGRQLDVAVGPITFHHESEG